jgi:ABC-type dipeptide/oligopeptide/nickel transport system permease subunit
MSLWLLAWRRLLRDPVGVASAAVVVAFIALAAASAAGWVARDWSSEVGVSYAPPGFLAMDAQEEQAQEVARALSQDDYGIKDPIGPELAEIQSRLTGASKDQAKQTTLAFGADKWGRDVVKKAIKGTETSLVVGFAAAGLATLLGTLFGALAGYYGRWADDFFNWLYSVFTSIPYLLLVLAVAAVLGQKGILTVILILGLTGWTGIFRLVRAEYLKHRVREYGGLRHGPQCGGELHGGAVEGGVVADPVNVGGDRDGQPVRSNDRHLCKCAPARRSLGKACFHRIARSRQPDSRAFPGKLRLADSRRIQPQPAVREARLPRFFPP